MILDDKHKDALAEIIGIAFGRAADSLSKLTGYRILFGVPRISIMPMSEMSPVLGEYVHGELATVHQIFTGTVSGDAMLLLDIKSAVFLSGLLTDERYQTEKLSVSAQEVLTEVGNILLNACLGTFGNLLKMKIVFSVPRLQLDDLHSMMNSLVIGQDEIRYALVIATEFRIRDSEVGGYLVIVLGVASLDLLIHAVENLG